MTPNFRTLLWSLSALGLLTVPASAIAQNASGTAVTTEPELAGLERLMAMEEMKNLRMTFCRALDSHDWAALRSTMTDDFSLEWKDTSGPGRTATRPTITMEGADKFITFAQQILAAGDSIHICVMPQFTYVRQNSAEAMWFINGFGSIGEQSGTGYERLVDTYVKVGDKWLIKHAWADIEVQLKAEKNVPFGADRLPQGK